MGFNLGGRIGNKYKIIYFGSLKKIIKNDMELDSRRRWLSDNKSSFLLLLPICCETKPVVNDFINPKLNKI